MFTTAITPTQEVDARSHRSYHSAYTAKQITGTGAHLMETVSFTDMKQGTQADYRLLDRHERRYVATVPDRFLGSLARLAEGLGGFRSRIPDAAAGALRAIGKAHPLAGPSV